MTTRATEAVDEAVRGRALLRSGGALPVAELARETGRSARHLQDRFRRETGLTPKTAARVIRFDRARHLLTAGPPPRPAEPAPRRGYFDQAQTAPGGWPALPGSFSAYVVTADPDGVHARAVAAGARVTAGLHGTDHGSRDFAAADPEGDHWYFGTYPGAPRPVPGC
ncbi:helix-turn-helix domain-containing protein [Streptomyces viridifaciens]|uniref:helix-turn-helix domain-containing protein n=1 Tax=Kitasatospora aureofaciens TaxID=1894 RepID=UPI000B2B8B50|nr:helix-turn-helix domain-containing protein [Streptomyces viridifaciens]